MTKSVSLLGVILSFSTVYAGPGTGFIENKNQWPCEIDFMANVPGGQMAIRAGQFNYFFLDYQRINELHESSHTGFSEVNGSNEDVQIAGQKVSVNFNNSNANAKPISLRRSEAYFNYFLGNNSDQWGSKAYAYKEIVYEGIYEGVDLKLSSLGRNIKYDLVIAPGFDPAQIQISYSGAASLMVFNGDLLVDAKLAQIFEKKPIAFQWIDGVKRIVVAEYFLVGDQLSFAFPDGYDPCYELVIDPLLIFSTYSGSEADNWGSTATPGENGSVYSSGVTNHFAGSTFSGTFLATPGAFQTNYGGLYDVAILKYDSAGENLLFASYLGGSASESPHSLVVDDNDELLILGTTSSNNFPTTAGVVGQNFNEVNGDTIVHVVSYFNGSDIFVSKISKDGSLLLASTYLGGSDADGLNPTNGALAMNYGDQLRGDIITDKNGDVYISSVTSSADFPVASSFNTTFNGSTDALILKLSGDLTQMLWGAFLGGSASDAAYTIKFDSEGKILVAGGTSSADFPITARAYQMSYKGNVDGWIAKLEPDGSGLIASTFTGTSAYDQIYFLDLNDNDKIYVYGQTAGDFPVLPSGVYFNENSGQFLQKFSNDLRNLELSTVFGSGRGKPDISPTAFLVNDCNNIYMTGWGGLVNNNINKPLLIGSSTTGMHTTPDAFQSTTSGSDFYFIVLTDDATEFLYGTFLGGTQSKTHVDGGTSRFDKSGIVYHAVCSGCNVANTTGRSTSDFPTTPNAWSNTNNSINCNNAAFKFDLASLRARIVTNSLALDQPGINKICLPDKIVFQNRSTGGEVYEWDFGDGTTDSKPDTVAIIHEYKNSGTYLVKLRAVDQGTCVGEDFDFATVVVNKAMGFAEADKTVCYGANVELIAGGGVQYRWFVKNDVVLSEVARPTFIPEDTTSFFVKITDKNTCVLIDTIKVNVVPGIDLKFEFNKVADCYSRAALRVVNNTNSMDEQYFDFGDGNTSKENEIVYNYKTDGNYHVKLVGKKEFCVYEESVDLPFFTIKVPNVITPGNADANSAGRNDFFRIIYGEQGDQSTSDVGVNVSLSIYNRWGKVVYKNETYDDSWAGEGLEAGVYYYDVNIENEPVCKGWVQLIR